MFGEHQLLNILNCIGIASLKENSYQSNIDVGCFFQTFRLPNLVLVLGFKDGHYETSKYYVSLVLRPT